jgi:hypothetical protein
VAPFGLETRTCDRFQVVEHGRRVRIPQSHRKFGLSGVFAGLRTSGRSPELGIEDGQKLGARRQANQRPHLLKRNEVLFAVIAAMTEKSANSQFYCHHKD